MSTPSSSLVVKKYSLMRPIMHVLYLVLCWLVVVAPSSAATVEFNATGGTTATNGLHFYIEDTTHMQVRRLNNTGQVYNPGNTPPSNALDNGIFLRANGKVYGPSHTVTTFNPTGGMFSTYAITATSPANPSSYGTQQVATSTLGVNAGPQISIDWKYITPLDFLIAEVTLTIPAGYAVSAANPVRFYHVYDTYLGGSDSGCGVKFTDSNGHLVVGTYPPSSGTSCPSSTSIPAGVSIVESFRERSGATFSNYCAAGWASFYTNGGVNCSVLQTAAMSNTIVTTYQDTGIGVEYDFTAPGTYTFSYDFVIGSTVVPAYDHLEIQHDGVATLCPETVKVLACTSTTVPCPLLNIVNTGTITGNLTVTPSLPAVTVTPASFSIGSSGSTASMVLQGSAPGGTYTLSSSGISGTPPLNGVKCWNATTGTASCSLVINNTPCVQDFDCMETGVAYNNLSTTSGTRNPLYTKLVNTDFKFDVVALASGGAQLASYTGSNVKVELFDDSVTPAPACSAYSAPVASQLITFAASDAGRKTITTPINLTKAYRKLRCRATDSSVAPTVYGCSSDDFTVRPKSFTAISSSTVNADGTGANINATPIVKAGGIFSLAADTGTPGYNDVPKINPTLLTSSGTAIGTLSGLFTTTANPVSGNGASGTAFTYGEVGYFLFKVNGVYDDSFTTYSNDFANGDCTNDFSNVNVSGKYGCKFGNAAVSPYFGRFIPDHFTMAGSLLTGGCSVGGFAYMDQPLGLSAKIEARNMTNGVTVNYHDTFGKGTVTAQMEDSNSGTPISLARLSLGAPTSPAWSGGVYSFSADKFNRLATPDGPYKSLDFGLSVTDESNAVLLVGRDMDANSTTCTADTAGTSNGTCPAKKIATTIMRYGRIKLGNAHGSEALALPIPLRLEFWDGLNGWQPNTLDSCSAVAANQLAFSFPAGSAAKPNNLSGCETMAIVSGSPPNQTVKLSAPGIGNNGWSDLTLNLGATASGNQCTSVGGVGAAAATSAQTWLQFNWLGTGQSNPKARATFGVYKNANEFIYLRELH